MIILRQGLFSRHTPNNLEEYESRDPRTLTRSQKRAAVEDEYDIAERNTNKYIYKKVKKHAGIGALAGAGIGAAVGKGRATTALYGGLGGGLAGLVTGSIRGKSKANEEGHDPEKRTVALGRRYDDDIRSRRVKGDADDYELYAKKHNKEKRRENIERQKAIAQSQMAYNSYNW